MKSFRSLLTLLVCYSVTLTPLGAQTLPQNAALMPIPTQQFLNASGKPLAGGFIYTYAAGTSTPQAAYTDSTAATPLANPVVLDSGGRAGIWLKSTWSYKIVATDAVGVQQWTADNVNEPALYYAAQLQTYISTLGTATLVTFTSPLTGGVSRTVASKLGDAPSVKDFGAVMNGSTDDSAALQACVNAAGHSCYIPTGTLKFATTITLPQSNDSAVAITCASRASVLLFTGAASDAFVLSGNANQPGLQIENCTLNGSSSTSGSNGLHLKPSQGGHLENNLIYGFGGDCLLNEGDNSVVFLNNSFLNCKNGIHNKGLVLGGSNYSANANTFIGGVIGGNSNWGIWEDAALSTTVGPNEKNLYQGVVLEPNGTAGTTSGEVWFQGCDNCELSASYQEMTYGVTGAPYNIVLGGTATDGFPGGNIATYYQGNSIHNNWFGSYQVSTITVLSARGWAVKDNSELGSPSYFLDLSKSSSTQQSFGVVTGNQGYPATPVNGTDASGTLVIDQYVSGVVNAMGPTSYGMGFGVISSIQPNTGVTTRSNGTSATFAFRALDHTGNTEFQVLDGASDGQLQWSFSGGGSYLTAGVPTQTRTITYPDASGTLGLLLYSGQTASIGGSGVAAGACVSGATGTISGLSSSMVAVASPVTDPGTGFYSKVSVGSGVTVSVCNATAGTLTPNATVFNVRVIE